MPPGRVVIPHSRPAIDPEDVRAVSDVLMSGKLAQGEEVRRFEAAAAALLGRRGGVATSSGTSALHLALLALGIGPGDEVLLPSYTCVALAHAVHYVGATPRLADISPHEYNLSPHEAAQHVTDRTRAIIVPHMFGLPAHVEPLAALGVPLIEDCSQSLGATYGHRPAGSVGTITVCSFYATKVMTTGEGGMLFSDSETILRRARDLRDYDGRPIYRLRFNYKMTDVQAALGLSQLRRLPAFLRRRQELASRYGDALRGLQVRLPASRPGRTHIFARYVIGVENAPLLADRLVRHGVQCRAPVFQPLHRYFDLPGFPVSEAAMRTALSLPLYPSLTDEEVETVVRTVAREIESDGERAEELRVEEPACQALSSRS